MSKSPPFEKQLADLETIVTSLEKGDLSLEDALKQFEHGIALAASCQNVLKQAELKITQLQSDALDLDHDKQNDGQ